MIRLIPAVARCGQRFNLIFIVIIIIAANGQVGQPSRNAVSVEMGSFLITGIFAILVSMGVMAWAAMFVQRKNGGLTLILLSIFMLLVGGGFIPPLFGVIAGLIGRHTNSKVGVSL